MLAINKLSRNLIQDFLNVELLQNKLILKFSIKTYQDACEIQKLSELEKIIPSFLTVFRITIGQKPVRGVAPLPVAASHP